MELRHHREGGFTLLELLMVVIVIAILASIALPQYVRVTERARTGQVSQLLASLRGSQLRYKAQSPSSVYTMTPGDLDIDATIPASLTGWDALTVASGTGAGANVSVLRNAVGGATDNAALLMDLDTGAVCTDSSTASTQWGVTSSAACP